jgi:hypothetical protein
MKIRSRGHSGDRLHKGIQIESIKSSKQRRRRTSVEDAIDSRQGAALTLMEKFSWEQLCFEIWQKSSHIFRMAFSPSTSCMLSARSIFLFVRSYMSSVCCFS